MRRFLAAATIAVGALFAATAPAGAVAFTTEEAAELQSIMAEAQEAQRICYSYRVTVRDLDGNESTDEYGYSWSTSRQPAAPIPSASACTKAVDLIISVRYTSSTSESSDAASSSINVTDTTTRRPDGQLDAAITQRLQISNDRMLNEYADATYDAIVALPGIVASTGAAPYLPLEVNTTELAAGDGLTDQLGSDVIRQNLGGIALFSIGFLAAITWLVWTFINARAERAAQQRRRNRRQPPEQEQDDSDPSRSEYAMPNDHDANRAQPANTRPDDSTNDEWRKP